MLFYLFLGFVLLVAAVALMAAYVRADPAALARGLRWGAFALAGLGLLLLPFIGRGSLLVLGPVVIVPLLSRLLMRHAHGGFGTGPRPGPRSGPSSGQTSAVETAWLAMTLDHDSGRMSGRVRAGRFAGRDLGSLGPDEVLDLLEECRAADPDSVPLIEAFLDRMHGPDWRQRAGDRERAGSGPTTHRGGMTREEAYEILGLEPGAGPEVIKEAHRSLMQKLHPDRGGSTYLAAKINQAKDLLLGN